MGSCFSSCCSSNVCLPSITHRDSNESLLSRSTPPGGVIGEPPPSYEASLAVSREQLVRMTDEERFQFVRRAALIQFLPRGIYNTAKAGKKRECVICMLEFAVGDAIRLLPCMHLYHVDCIDDWLQRSFTCPLCMEEIDTALLQTPGVI